METTIVYVYIYRYWGYIGVQIWTFFSKALEECVLAAGTERLRGTRFRVRMP